MCVCVEQLCEVVSHTECVCVRRLGEVHAPSSSTHKCLIETSTFLLTLRSTSSAWKVRKRHTCTVLIIMLTPPLRSSWRENRVVPNPGLCSSLASLHTHCRYDTGDHTQWQLTRTPDAKGIYESHFNPINACLAIEQHICKWHYLESILLTLWHCLDLHSTVCRLSITTCLIFCGII